MKLNARWRILLSSVQYRKPLFLYCINPSVFLVSILLCKRFFEVERNIIAKGITTLPKYQCFWFSSYFFSAKSSVKTCIMLSDFSSYKTSCEDTFLSTIKVFLTSNKNLQFLLKNMLIFTSIFFEENLTCVRAAIYHTHIYMVPNSMSVICADKVCVQMPTYQRIRPTNSVRQTHPQSLHAAIRWQVCTSKILRFTQQAKRKRRGRTSSLPFKSLCPSIVVYRGWPGKCGSFEMVIWN